MPDRNAEVILRSCGLSLRARKYRSATSCGVGRGPREAQARTGWGTRRWESHGGVLDDVRDNQRKTPSGTQGARGITWQRHDEEGSEEEVQSLSEKREGRRVVERSNALSLRTSPRTQREGEGVVRESQSRERQEEEKAWGVRDSKVVVRERRVAAPRGTKYAIVGHVQ